MSITVAPNVNLDTLNGLSANKKYFLSSTTGEIKEASIWMRMKCAIGVASARQKVSNLVDAVRTSLLNAAEQARNKALDDDIRSVDLKHMVKGSDIKNVVRNFSSANAETLLKTGAKSVAKIVARHVAGMLATEKCGIGSGKVLASIISHALKPIANDLDNLPVVAGSLDKKELASTMKHSAEDVKNLIDDIVMDRRLGVATIDKHYAKHIIDTLFNADGTRNNKTIADLKTPIQVKVDAAFHLNEKLLDNHPQIVYRDLKSKNVDPEQKVAEILSFCDGKKELEEMALELMPKLCENSNYVLRSDETIKKRIAGLKQNLDEIDSLEKSFPGCRNGLKAAILTLDGKSFPKGLIKNIATFLETCSFDKFVNLNSLSSAAEVYEGLDQFHSVIDDMSKKINFTATFEASGEEEVGGPQANASKMVATTLAIAKMGPALKARLPGIIQGDAFKKMTSCLDTILSLLSNKDYDVVGGGYEKCHAARGIVEDQFGYLNFLGSAVNVDREAPLELESGGEADINAEPAISIRYVLSDAANRQLAAQQEMPLLDEK